MDSKKRKRIQFIWRTVIRAAFFFLMPSAFVAGFNGIKNLFGWIGRGEPLSLNTFVLTLILLCVFTIVTGRFFCGYLCAFGSANDLFYGLSVLVQKKLLKKKKLFAIPEKVMRILRKLKYINLAVIILFCVTGLALKFGRASVWEVFSQLTAFRLPPFSYLAGILLLAAVFVLGMFKERFFCQCLCPMGALFSLLPVLPFLRLRRNAENCIPNCRACQMQCPAGLKLQEDGPFTGECIGCGKCTASCPRQNISYADGKLAGSILPVIIRAGIFFVLGTLLGLCRLI